MKASRRNQRLLSDLRSGFEKALNFYEIRSSIWL